MFIKKCYFHRHYPDITICILLCEKKNPHSTNTLNFRIQIQIVVAYNYRFKKVHLFQICVRLMEHNNVYLLHSMQICDLFPQNTGKVARTHKKIHPNKQLKSKEKKKEILRENNIDFSWGK